MEYSFRLESIPLFASLNSQQRQWISAALEQLSFGAGEDIFIQGTPADSMIILLSGQAILFTTNPDGSQSPLAHVGAGEQLNQGALFAEAVQSATLRAAQPVTLFKLTRKRLRELLSAHPELGPALGINEGTRNAPLINPLFAEQREDEEILIQTHRHWWSFVRTAWLPMLLMPAMWVGVVLVEVQVLALGLFALSFLLPGSALVYFFLEWRNDSVIVTDQRVIRINRTILAMYRQVTQVGLESIHEINFDIPSYDPFARIFRYGTVIVKTAGAQGNLELDFMPNPEQFQKLIIEDRQYFEDRQAQRHHKLVRAELERWTAGDVSADESQASASMKDPPQPMRGSNGYLSSRIMMSNGDIVYRKHTSVWAQHTAIPIVIVLASLFALLLTFTLLGTDLRIFAFPFCMVGFLIGCLAYYWMDWDWRNDLYIISDDTITLVHKRPFFLQNIRDQILVERIDNVESVSSGVLAALLKYGDVRMSLVGADEPKLFTRVARPQEVQQEISRRQHNKSLRRARYDAVQQRQIIGEYLGVAPGTTPQGSEATYPNLARPSPTGAAHDNSQNDGVARGAIRTAANHDRNRPSRLPRKLLASSRPKVSNSPLSDTDERRRPQRFREDRADDSPA